MARKYMILVFIILLSSCKKSQDNNNIILKYYGDAYEDIGYSIALTDNGYVIAGQFTDITRSRGNYIAGSAKKFAIIKTGTDGNMIWEKSFGDSISVASKVLVLSDGSIIATGYIVTDSISLRKAILVVKVNTDGTGAIQNVILNPTNSKSNVYGTDIIQTTEGFLILGTTDAERLSSTDSTGNAAGKNDIFLQRIDNNLGSITVPTQIGFPGNDEGVAIKADINGGYVIVGTTDRSWPGQTQNNILLLRVNSDLSVTKVSIIGGTKDEYAADIEVLNDGYLIAGTVGGAGTNQNGYVWKIPVNIFDPPVFAHNIMLNTTSDFSVNAICKYKTSSFIMAGQATSGSFTRMLIFALDADGNLIQGKEMNTGGTGSQVAYDVITDDEDNIIVVGGNSYENNSMISLLKFSF